MANRKALHIINGEHYSGGERIQDILGMTLPQYGYDVGFVCLKPDMFPNVYRSKASPVYSVPMKHKADFMLYKKVAEIIKTEGYDIVHSHMPRSIPVARLASLSAKVPMVHHLHSPTLFEGPSLLNNIVSGILERVSLIGADAVIPCSEGLGKYAKQIGIGSRRVKVVLNGIPGLGLNAEKKAPNDEWVIGVVALFRPRKGFEYLLEAMSLLKARGYSFKLHAIGGFFSQEYRDHIDQLVSKLDLADLIEWAGFTEDVAAELRRLDIFVLPSTHGEGLPIATLEAMSVGLPVVTTNIPGNDEVIRDGLDGYLCKPEDGQSLADNLEKIMSQPDNWAKLSASAYQRQQESFSDESMTSAIASVYDNILSGR